MHYLENNRIKSYDIRYKPRLATSYSIFSVRGKQPSVALMKARLAQNVPMPIIIQALQSWKKNAKVPKITEHKREISLEQRIEQLERQVAILTQRLSQLES